MRSDGLAPTVDPFCILVAHVNATVAHLVAEIIVPESPVQSDSMLVEERYPRDSQQFIGFDIRGQIAISHVS